MNGEFLFELSGICGNRQVYDDGMIMEIYDEEKN